MLATVTLYASSGLTPGNSMESLTTLQEALYIHKKFNFEEVAVKQDKGLSVIRLNIPYEQGKNLDYAIIGQVGYWVDSVTWLNDDCCSLALVCDVITTVGIDNIEIVSGWCIRRHVDIDEPFTNIIPEPFTPTDPFQVDYGGKLIHDSLTVRDLNVVLAMSDLSVSSTLPLAEPWKVPADLVEEVGEVVGVFTPRINPLDMFTIYHMDVWNGDGILESKQTTVPYTSAFNIDSPATQRNLATLNALGLNNVVLESYILPKEYISQLNYVDTVPEWPWWSNPERLEGTLVDTIKCDDQVLTSELTPTFGQYKNAKVYSGQFQKICLLSLTSGEEEVFSVEDIVAPTAPNNIFWRVVADVRYNGCPLAYPQTYKLKPNFNYLGCVKGSQWQTAPIKAEGQAGYQAQQIKRRQEFVKGLVAPKVGVDDWSGNVVLGMAKGASEMAKAKTQVAEGVVSEIARYTIGEGYNETNVPSLPFNQLPTMQNYFGNNFYDYRVRLSDHDMARFDDFLTQFGYAVNEKMSSAFFRGRVNYNFVQAESINVRLTGYSDLSMNRAVKLQLEAGIRVWHVAPDGVYIADNPIKEVTS